jgi:hypothetical protein
LRLSKRDAEDLMDAIDDAVELRWELTRCLRVLCDAPTVEWPELLDRAATIGGWKVPRQAALRAGDLRSLQELATELNEQRGLAS